MSRLKEHERMAIELYREKIQSWTNLLNAFTRDIIKRRGLKPEDSQIDLQTGEITQKDKQNTNYG